MKFQYSGKTERKLAVKLIRDVSEKEGINLKEMQPGSLRGKTPKTRSDLAYQLITEYGMTLAETGRQLGVCPHLLSQNPVLSFPNRSLDAILRPSTETRQSS